MTWNRIALCINDIAGVLLVMHLVRLRLHKVYSVFALFVVFDLAATSAIFLDAATGWIDYRILFTAISLLSWAATFWLVYALLEALLSELPGILKFSRKLLNGVFLVAIAFAAIASIFALTTAHVTSLHALIDVVPKLERVISTVALLLLLIMLAFVLWFPVKLPRNLVFFSFAIVAYFAVEAAFLLVSESVSKRMEERLYTAALGLLSVCFVFLMTNLTQEGERVTLRIGHKWNKREQAKLLGQLEGLNEALARTAGQV